MIRYHGTTEKEGISSVCGCFEFASGLVEIFKSIEINRFKCDNSDRTLAGSVRARSFGISNEPRNKSRVLGYIRQL